MPAAAFAHFHNYGPAVFAIVVEGGEDPVIGLRGFVRIGVQAEGGAQEPTLHTTLLVGNGVEIEGIGELADFGLRGDIFTGIAVDIAAQPTVFDIVQGVLNAVASQYNLPGTVGAKINSAGSGGVDTEALAAAVWNYVNRTLSQNPGITEAQMIAALTDAVLPVEVIRINGVTLAGGGTTEDPMRPA